MSITLQKGEMPATIPDGKTVKYLSPGKLLLEHTERAILIFGYCIMLILAINNTYQYIIKRKMYKSYPMLVSYILLLIFCSVTIAYEFFMTLKCAEHDCTAYIIRDPESHSSNIVYFLWKLRQ